MTNLSLFEFITYHSSQKEFKFKYLIYLNYIDHNFIPVLKFRDNSGAKVKCNNCNINAFIAKKSNNEFYVWTFNTAYQKHSCNELIIKNILE